MLNLNNIYSALESLGLTSQKIPVHLQFSNNLLNDQVFLQELLLQYGADPNQNTAQYPIKGYTPFMLAVEKDNAYAVDLMLTHGAQLEQSYVKADEGRRVFLEEIAEYFKANQAKTLIGIA